MTIFQTAMLQPFASTLVGFPMPGPIELIIICVMALFFIVLPVAALVMVVVLANKRSDKRKD